MLNIYKRELERIDYDKEIKSVGIEKMLIVKNHNWVVIGKKKPKILVGDYNPSSARNTCGTLMRMGFDVDVVETAEAWQIAITSEKTPSILALSRQNVPTIRKNAKENKSSDCG